MKQPLWKFLGIIFLWIAGGLVGLIVLAAVWPLSTESQIIIVLFGGLLLATHTIGQHKDEMRRRHNELTALLRSIDHRLERLRIQIGDLPHR